jgi:hypothetical protein
MTDVATTVDAYVAMWNEPDPDLRTKLIETAWVDDARYVDPLLEAAGHEELNDMITGVQSQFPGHQIRRTSAIDAHHDEIRFGWELAGPDGTIAVAGIDVGTVATDGRLARITGFFGAVPE